MAEVVGGELFKAYTEFKKRFVPARIRLWTEFGELKRERVDLRFIQNEEKRVVMEIKRGKELKTIEELRHREFRQIVDAAKALLALGQNLVYDAHMFKVALHQIHNEDLIMKREGVDVTKLENKRLQDLGFLDEELRKISDMFGALARTENE